MSDDGNVVMGEWRVVVSPRGDVVRLTSSFDTMPAELLLAIVSEGWVNDGHSSRVSVNGRHIALAWKEAA